MPLKSTLSLLPFVLMIPAASQAVPLPELLSRARQRAGLSMRQVAGLSRRAHWSALLPRVHAGVRQSLASGDTVDLRADRSAALDFNNYRSWRWSVSASWDLRQLLYTRQDLAIERLRLGLSERRAALDKQVIELYFRFRQAARCPASPERRWVRARSAAQLAALTGLRLDRNPPPCPSHRSTNRLESKAEP
ncbi:MAG: hypothetical protein H6707_16400 [Deltaproteobacteria bacterium]|nr:hypothetical protein [Deltaproteobacteria bacterium]